MFQSAKVYQVYYWISTKSADGWYSVDMLLTEDQFYNLLVFYARQGKEVWKTGSFYI